ncbi:hypothetical protein [Cyclobacterium roseum]|uniref:hypothetical protein n=1 Tax=Cyclobacterium roseum TaxID=2666137 RepID=UPI00139094AD|nr:hypothetical protein [Cyclobacterium roseum]
MSYEKIISRGYDLMGNSTIVICSIVRDCEKNLKKNIPRLNQITKKFKNFQILIFENDSIDNTKSILQDWQKNNDKVFISCHKFNEYPINHDLNKRINKYYSSHRISKMAAYRNQYMEEIRRKKQNFDFMMVIDLDINNFSQAGIAHSFGLADQWDAVSANGISYSPLLKKRYHDSYALIEMGNQDGIQKLEQIKANQYKWSFLKKKMPLIPVYSAFGGLALYHFDCIKDKSYLVIPNDKEGVEVKCEHFSIHDQIQKEVKQGIFINPNMIVNYQSINKEIILRFIQDKVIPYK